jgi:hypothetical protein
MPFKSTNPHIGVNKKAASRLQECAGWELNPHASRHMALNHACLPIPAPAQEWMYYNPVCRVVKQINQFF